MTSAGYLRFPHVHGDLLAFVAEDDVWLAPQGGGRAWRLSADRAQVAHPRFARDGASVAWTSWRDGPAEVYLAGVDGERGRRLTYWGDQDAKVCGWTPDGEVIALTASGQAFERQTWAHAIPLDGGAPRLLPFGPVADVAMEATAQALLNGTWGRDPAFWKRYRGGTAGRLWAAVDGAPFHRLLADVNGQFASPMLVGDRLAFLSDHEGTGNVYSCRLDGSDLRRHTDHDGFYARQASTDGSRVVYQCRAEIWILDDLAPDSEPRQVNISLGSAATALAPRLTSAADHLGDLSCDDKGRASAVEVRGTVHWLTHRDGPARALAVAPEARARLPRVLGRSGQVVWVSDAGGADALEIAPATGPELVAGAGPAGPRRLAEGQLGLVNDLAAAPDGSTVAVAARDGRLLLVDIASGEVTQLAQSLDGAVSGLAYAPDSAWLAWSHPGPQPLSRIRLARLADSTIVDVTEGRFIDSEPAFTGDGKYLAFLSARIFDPVYDAHFFDLSFPYGSRPYLVPLAADTPSPFAPLSEGRPVGNAPDKPDDEPGDKTDDKPASQDGADGSERREPEGGPPPVTVDVEGLAERVVSVPVAESRYSSLHAVAAGLAWLREPVTGVLGEGAAVPNGSKPRAVLERFDLGRQKATELVSGLDWFAVSGDGEWLVVRDERELRVVPSQRKADPDSADTVVVDLSRARFIADPVAQWRHAYDEAGRYMRHDFWVADMAEVDWDGVLDSYRSALPRIGSSRDFADLLWEVVGELGTSHAYIRPGASPGDGGNGQVGLLGADLTRAADGTWRVARVLPGESSDPQARSPLATPGVAVRPGDVLLAVDGRPVDPAVGPGPLLVGSAGKPVELTVASDGEPPRRFAVTPLRSERRLRYQDWVAGKRRLVRELSGGRAGYLHIPDMMGEGWAHFHRDLRVEMARDALVVDVRANRGGHVSELVVEKLARRIMGWDMPRWMNPSTYPRDAPRGPVIALADENAGSDGDMVTAAIRMLGLGPVVGTRTWGGVIGIEAPFTLVDGTAMTVPRYAIWLDGFGWGVENHGVDPDVEVVPSPGDWAEGRDVQLETAVRLAAEQLQARPPARPPDTADRPSRRRPPLPPRAQS
ncbi:MAG TPA: PDZ domain-containing protein [Streptosporangiaceae bacterium]|nr:PDZ domain-containing protein [Streptosporangiaceae bacterium]